MNQEFPSNVIYNIDGRQHPDVAYFEISLENFNDPLFNQVISIELPPSSQITRMFANVTDTFNAATTDTLVIGDDTDDDRYGAAVDLKTAGLKQFTPTGFIYGPDGTLNYLRIKRVATGTAATKGTLRLFVETVAEGKAYHTQG